MKRLTAGFLVFWTAGYLAIGGLQLAGLTYLLMQTEDSEVNHLSLLLLPLTMAILPAFAFGFYNGLKRHIKSRNPQLRPELPALRWRRIAILSVLATAWLGLVRVGIFVLSRHEIEFGILLVSIATVVAVWLTISTLRHYRRREQQSLPESEYSLGPVGVLSVLVEAVVAYLVFGTLFLQYKATASAVFCFVLWAGVVVPTVIAAVKEVVAREALRAPETRIFRMAMTILGLAALAVASLGASGVLLIGMQLPWSAAGLFVVGVICFWLLFRECKKAEVRLDAIAGVGASHT